MHTGRLPSLPAPMIGARSCRHTAHHALLCHIQLQQPTAALQHSAAAHLHGRTAGGTAALVASGGAVVAGGGVDARALIACIASGEQASQDTCSLTVITQQGLVEGQDGCYGVPRCVLCQVVDFIQDQRGLPCWKKTNNQSARSKWYCGFQLPTKLGPAHSTVSPDSAISLRPPGASTTTLAMGTW